MTRLTFRLNSLLGAAAVAAMLIIPGVAQAQDAPALPDAIKQQGEIRFGVKCDLPPFGMTGTDGKPTGIEIDMAKEIAALAFGSPDKANLICVTTEARIPSLTSGKIDLILATLGKFAEREKIIDYSTVYFWGSSYGVTLESTGLKDIQDLAGKNVLIVKGASQIKWLRENVPTANIIELDSTADGLQALKQGRAEAYVGDGSVMLQLASNDPDLIVLSGDVDPGVNGIGIRKGEADLKAFVDFALAKLKADKFYDTDVPKYIDNKLILDATLKGFTTEPPAK